MYLHLILVKACLRITLGQRLLVLLMLGRNHFLQVKRHSLKTVQMEKWSVKDKNKYVKVEAVVTTVKIIISNPSRPRQISWVPRTFNPFVSAGHNRLIDSYM